MKLATIVFITAKSLERDAVVAHIKNPICLLEGKNYTVGEYRNWQVIVRLQTNQGNSQARVEVTQLINQFKPTYLFFVGVAGGIKDVKKGSVVVAKKVIGYEKAKLTEETIKARPDVENLSNYLAEIAQHVVNKRLWLNQIIDPTDEPPQAQVSPIASGDKNVSSTQMLKQLESFASEAVALDMESIGFMQGIADHLGVQGMVIRGISDFCIDKDETNDNKWQPIAARHAAAFAFAILDELLPVTLPQSQLDNISSEVDNIGGKRLPESPPAVTPLYLLIALEPKTKKPKTYLVQAWLIKGPESPRRITLKQETIPLKGVPTLIKNLLGEIKVELRQNKNKLTLEFFLPTDLLNNDVEEWIPGSDYPIGVDYCVVVRPLERVRLNERLNRLHGYWESHKLTNAVKECAVWLETADNCSNLNEGVIFFGLNFVPDKNCFKELVKSGIPMALWIRQETAKQWQNDLYHQEFSCCRLEELPECLRKQRRVSWNQYKHTGHLSLLWDDPTRIPQELQEGFKLSDLQP